MAKEKDFRVVKYYEKTRKNNLIEVYYCQQKLPILGWVYFYTNSLLDNIARLISLGFFIGACFLFSIFSIGLGVIDFLQSTNYYDKIGFSLITVSILFILPFLFFILILKWREAIDPFDYEQEAKDALKKRYESINFKKVKVPEKEIIYYDITVERKQKLDKLNLKQ